MGWIYWEWLEWWALSLIVAIAATALMYLTAEEADDDEW